MPTKQRSTSGVPVNWLSQYKGSYYCNQPSDVGHSSSSNGTVPYEKSKEFHSWTDSLGQARYNGCEHWRWRLVSVNDPTIEQFNGVYPHDRVNGIPASFRMTHPAWWMIQQVMPVGFKSSNMWDRHWHSLYGQCDMRKVHNIVYRRLLADVRIDRKVSILNFIHELRDVKKLFDFWSTKRDLLKNIANGHLNNEFGWKPFLADLCGILKALNSTRRKLKHLLKQEGRIRVLRGNAVDVFEIYPVEEVFHLNQQTCLDNCYLNGYSFVTIGSLKNHKVDCRYTVKYSYYLPKFSERQAEMRAFCDAFGITWDPQILWDAIPFSFMVDWFFDVGGWLNKLFAMPAVDPIIRVHEACYTMDVIQTSICEADIPFGDMAAQPVSTKRVSAVYEGKRFHRLVTFPTQDDLMFAGWGLRQLEKLSLGLALVTNTPRPKIKKLTPRKKRTYSGNRRWLRK